jgi:hypothetical protein
MLFENYLKDQNNLQEKYKFKYEEIPGLIGMLRSMKQEYSCPINIIQRGNVVTLEAPLFVHEQIKTMFGV